MLQLQYKEFGHGRPLVILHGLFGSARNWQGIAREIARTHRVIAPDMRNHGQSPHVETMTYLEMADDVMKLIEQLGLSSPIILGHSMGGKVAMTLALQRPELVSGMVIVDIAPVSYDHDFENLIGAMCSLSPSKLASRSQAEELLLKKLDSKKLAGFIMQNLVRGENGFEWRINLDVIASSLPELGQFPENFSENESRIPTLFIGGANSSYIRSIHNPAIYQHFPAAEIRMINEAGHWVHADKPKQFLELVTDFIRYI